MKDTNEILKKYKIPSNPANAYAEEWKGWADFLGHVNVWSNKEILFFLNSIENELEFLEPREIIEIINQSGSRKVFSNNENFIKLIKSEPYSYERKESIENLINDYIPEEPADLDEIESDNTSSSELNIQENSDYVPVDGDIKNKFIQELKAFDNKRISSIYSSDEETIEFLLKYRHDKLWSDLMCESFDIESLKKEIGGKYFTVIKNRFLTEYEKVISLKIPEDYQFKNNPTDTKISMPNLMQRLISHRVIEYKKYANWSSMGAGKTLSGILAGRIGGLKNTLIITFNSNVEDWEEAILNAFPVNSVILSKEKKYIPLLNKEKHNYIIFNYEAFQNEKGEAIMSAIVSSNIDYIILDEVQLVKQREEETSSNRRKAINSMLRQIEQKNAKQNKETYILAMSATPVINNLQEPKKILELFKGIKYDDLKTVSNANNALNIHKHMFISGVRFKPKYNIKVHERFIKIDGRHLAFEYQNIPREKILNLERLFMADKILSTKFLLKKGVIIYTHYVTDIIPKIKKFVEDCGFSTGIYTGLEKGGLQCFKKGKCDILICSAPIGTGVDGLQKICNRLIVLSLPWTDSEYENLKGRIVRQGSIFNEVEIIVPQVEIKVNGEDIGWDQYRLNRLLNKKTLANAALDGIVPDTHLPSTKEMLKQAQDNFKKWIKRIEKNGLIQLTREKFLILEEDALLEITQEHPNELKLDTNIISEITVENTETNEDEKITEDTITALKEISTDKNDKIEREINAINRALRTEGDIETNAKSTLTQKQQQKIEEIKKKKNIPVFINDRLTVYVDDPSKIEAAIKKYKFL